MNKRQKIKHLQRINAKHIEARLELSKALNNSIEENLLLKHHITAVYEINEKLKIKTDFLENQNNKPLLSRLWRWKK